MTTKTDEYRAKAAECTKLAQHTTSPTMVGVYQDVACMWLRLAEQADSPTRNRALAACRTGDCAMSPQTTRSDKRIGLSFGRTAP
jgi:hypothetical protein